MEVLRLACDISRLSGGLPARLAAVKNAGFNGCILSATDLQESGLSKADLAEFLQMAELKLVFVHDESEQKALIRSSDFAQSSRIGTAPQLAMANAIQVAVLEDFEGDGTRHSRPLGLGTFNNESIVKALLRNGFHGVWAVQPIQVLGASISDLVRDAYRALVTLLDDVQRQLPTHASLGSPSLPPRAVCQGIEFVEFRTAPHEVEQLRALLSSLRFRLERRHLDLDVELWRQGAINIVINLSLVDGVSETRVCDIGLRIDSEANAMARADALGAFRQLPEGETGSLNAPAIYTVGNDLLHLMDSVNGATRVWETQFELVQPPSQVQPAGLRRIDHIGQTMPLADMDSWALWYVTTFELQHESLISINDQGGTTRSQAIAASEGQVRLNLNGARDAETLSDKFVRSHADGGVQHLALGTDDIFETAALLNRSQFKALEIPESYYLNLRDQYALDPNRLQKLQDNQLLYDRDKTGEYFQLYSEASFGGFFFEIVERRQGYNGYGATNAATRLSAQQAQRTVDVRS